MKKKTILIFSAICLTLFSCSKKTNVFVSPEGNDNGFGTINKPFLSVQKAVGFVREQREKGEHNTFNIQLREGEYYFEQSIVLSEKDSGILIKPYKDEKVRFTGGKTISPNNIKLVSGTENEKIFPKQNRADIMMVELKKLGITDYGELHPVGFGRTIKPVWMELFINGKPWHLSRWPNDSSVGIGKIINEGSVASKGDNGNVGGKFTYTATRPATWKKPQNIWIYGYFNYGWADDAVNLAAIDTTNKTFTTRQPHRYGFATGKPWNHWYAYNIVEEIDTADEYYIDREKGILYFFNPGKLETIEVSVLEAPFIEMDMSSNVIIRGITFDCARGSAVEMHSTQDCHFYDCTFKNLGCYAINIEGKAQSKKNSVENCSVYQTGMGGIRLYGGNRETLVPAGNFVENCSVHDFNRIAKTYCAGIKVSGVGNRISNNEIFNSPHVAILLSGNDHLIEYNEIHDVCLKTDDVGAVYYGRNPSERGNVVQFNFFHHLGNIHRTTAVYHDDGACGMKVHGNVFYKAGTLPVLIGGGSDNSYTNNVFVDCPVGIKVDNRMQAFEWAKPMIAKGGAIDQRLKEIHHDQPPYSTKYPKLAKYWDDNPSFPKRNKIDANVFVNIGQVILKVDDGVNSDKDFLDFTNNNLITNEDPGFVDMEKQNFKLKDSSAIFEEISGFEQIPFEKMGKNM